MNPKDIMNDAIHNFHPQYQQYTQYNTTPNNNESIRRGPINTGSANTEGFGNTHGNAQNRQISTISQAYTEKTMLLSSDDEFQ